MDIITVMVERRTIAFNPYNQNVGSGKFFSANFAKVFLTGLACGVAVSFYNLLIYMAFM
jgi:hypothetical protein